MEVSHTARCKSAMGVISAISAKAFASSFARKNGYRHDKICSMITPAAQTSIATVCSFVQRHRTSGAL